MYRTTAIAILDQKWRSEGRKESLVHCSFDIHVDKFQPQFLVYMFQSLGIIFPDSHFYYLGSWFCLLKLPFYIKSSMYV